MFTFKKLSAERFLQIFLGVVFLSAGIYRLFHWQLATLEFSLLQLPYPWLTAGVIAFEIVGGLFLITNRWPKITLLAFTAFLGTALIYAYLLMGQNLVQYSAELFVFNLTPTDFVLHFTYLVMLGYLLKKSF